MRITYEITTPESAEIGDFEEIGFVEPAYHMNVPVGESGEWLPSSLEWTLADAERFMGRGGCEDSGRWFSQASGSTDYATGAETRYCVHPSDNVSEASYERLKRIFC